MGDGLTRHSTIVLKEDGTVVATGKNKESQLVLSKIKSYIVMNGGSTYFQTDNGKEFKNLELKIFLENNNITYITSAPYHPQSNGCCEAIHKEIKKFLLDDLAKKKKLLI